MLEILKYVTSELWIFVGCAILLSIVVQGIVAVIRAIVKPFCHPDAQVAQNIQEIIEDD